MKFAVPTRFPLIGKALACVLAAAFAMSAAPASAAIPGSVAIEGVVQAKGGGPAADGTYAFVFSLYAAGTGGKAIWSESIKLKVSSGAFSHVLGSVKPISAAAVNGAKSLWIGAKIGGDPELPRERIHSVFFAHGSAWAATADTAKSAATAKSSANLSCTGCVKTSALAFDGDFNLKGKALIAGKVAVSGDVVSGGTVSAKSLTGDGSKLGGVARANTACSKTGEVVKGIDKNGLPICVKSMDPNALPPDGLAKVSNGLVSNQFVDTIQGQGTVAIKDNSPVGVTSTLTFPDIGIAQKLWVYVKISGHKGDANAVGIGDLVLTLTDPKGKKFVLHNKSGKGTSIALTWPPTKTASGDLSSWHGSNPKGKWTLHMLDTKYLNNNTDGVLDSWSIKIQTLSNKKVQSTGDHHVLGTLFGGVQLKTMTKDPFKCDASRTGYVYFNTAFKALQVCEGKEWVPIHLSPLGSQSNPGASCKDIFTRRPGVADGNYWLDPDGPSGNVAAALLYCDMKGGGWTRIEETTSYATKVYSESSKYYPFNYKVSDGFINALKKTASAAKQDWACATRGVGSQNYFKGWNNSNYKQSGNGGCWHSNNNSTVSSKGTHTNLTFLPVRAWQSYDCGDSSEYCSYNVGHAWLK